MPANTIEQPQTPASHAGLAALALSMLMASLGTSIANVGLPALAAAFGASFQAVQWVVLAYLLAITTLIVGIGRLGDVIGRRRLLLGGIALYTAASLLCAAAPSLWTLVAARAAQGVGAAVLMALAMAMAGGTVAKDRTGSAMGLLGTTSAVGTALGPSLGGVLIAAFGWPAIFLAGVPLGGLALALAWRGLPADPPGADGRRTGFDRLGTLVLALTLAAYALAMTVGRGTFGPLNLALLAAAGVGIRVFAGVERRAAAPLIRPALFREPVLRAGLATSALVMTVMMATLVVGPFYLSRGLGLDTAGVGLVLSVGPALAALSGVPAGRLVDRFGATVMMVAGLAGMAAGASGLALLPALFGVPGYVAAIAVLTPSFQAFQAANGTAVMADTRPDEKGVVSGMLNLSRNLGLVTGASAMGAVFAIAAGTADVAAAGPEAVTTGLRATFAVAAGLILAALAVATASRIPVPDRTTSR